MIAELTYLLDVLEWAAKDDMDVRYCTVCDNDKSEGHALGCRVGKMMRRIRAYHLHKAKGCKDNRDCHAVVYHHAPEEVR